MTKPQANIIICLLVLLTSGVLYCAQDGIINSLDLDSDADGCPDRRLGLHDRPPPTANRHRQRNRVGSEFERHQISPVILF